ncbi:MAG: 2-succinyl-5-enolpyruvyl-6-hydroxy-3-cyclohexene-1-carboxylic-acid synthase, partial [Acidimicrobiia bacterium]
MTAANPSQALAMVLADEVARCGMEHAVLAPGSRSTALAMAFHQCPSIRLHVETDERSAAFLAVGIGKATGRAAAVITTSGTAAANLHPAVVEADAARAPLLLLTADRPPELRHTGANQTIDQLKMFGGTVRWFCEVGVPEDRPGMVRYWRSTACRAWGEAVGTRGPAGPVHLNLAFREPTVPAVDDGRSRAPHEFSQDLDGRPAGRPWVEAGRSSRSPGKEEVEVLASLVDDVERGLVVVGETGCDPEPVHELARLAGWPVIAEPLSGARHGELVVSTAALLAGCSDFAAAHRPEAVLRIGRLALSRAVAELVDAAP